MPASFSQAFGFSGLRVSMLMATTSNVSPPSFVCSSSSAGISLRQGTHQVAHRFSSTVWPRQSRERARLAVGVLEGEVGQPLRARPRCRPPRLRRARAARGAWPAPPAGGRPRSAALRCIAPIPYTAASPTATPANAADERSWRAGVWRGRFGRAGRSSANFRRSGHEQQDVGRAVRVGPRRHHGGDQRLDRLRPAPLPPGHRGKQGPCGDAGQARHHHARTTPGKIAHGLDTILSEIEGGKFTLQARARRHPYERRVAARRADRAGGRAAAHRALAQRPGRDRFPALGARRHRRARRGACRLTSRRWPRRRWSMPRP